jgi:BirA family transcriptional regulator, biotin operon repressor / biotin---[acetyl-CoA-carboxylase] ligase
MDLAASMAAEGAAHGVVIAAREQTAGRGRRGSTWVSPAGAGLYFSFIARPREHRTIPLITIAAGVGVRNGIVQSTGLEPVLKWPNDVLVGRRKLAGILAEGHALGSPAQAVVIGVGVNVRPASYPPDVAARATSIEDELGRTIDPDLLLTAILAGLDQGLAALSQDPGDILRSWRAASPGAHGTRVEWDGRAGITAGIDDTGALLVNTSAGVERIIAGELHWNL